MTPGALHYVRRGSGEPLVLIHPLGAELVVWEPVMERLARERDVIAVDLPGFGRSPGLDRTPTPRMLADAVGGLMDDLGLSRAHVAGNSLGGWVALELAKAGRALSVTGLCTAGLWSRPIGPRPGPRRPRHGSQADARPADAAAQLRAGASWSCGHRWRTRSGCHPRRPRGWCART